MRSSAAILRQISPSIDEAWQALDTVRFRLSSGFVACNGSRYRIRCHMCPGSTIINELSSSLMLYTGKTQTMTVTIFQEISRGGYGSAAALSTILTVTMIGSLLLFFRLTKAEDIDL